MSGGETTFRVSELGEAIRLVLGEAFPAVWVVGEVQRLRASRNGHVYFELVEKGQGDEIVGKIDGVIWRTDFQRVRRLLSETGQELRDGVDLRCRGRVEFYPAGGRLQLIAREVDPVFTLGLLARRRQETLAALAAAGLLERNKGLALSLLPLRLGLVTSHDSAAYHDFLATLGESGYCFQVLLVHAAVQGREAERQVVSALRAVARLGVDCAVVIRGGGSRSDLAAFDSRAIAEAIAGLPVPVLTGLGHEIDQSVADLVAHTALKTPTMVGQFLVRRVEAAERRLAEAAEALCAGARERLREAREGVGGAEQGVRSAGVRLRREGERVEEMAGLLSRLATQRLRRVAAELAAGERRLAAAVPRLLARQQRAHRRVAERVVASGRLRLREAIGRCDGLARLCRELAPQRVLERGFSITRTAGGALLRTPRGVVAGERIVTELAAGRLTSRVEER
ncbi:MAG TPA: exodeoxyribonuclease VII large subunit [Thermoanaerobaculia bacterium]|nr:exodeoxyribonuclease VII large subunit [Thermoanaerobaculia bacterium]